MKNIRLFALLAVAVTVALGPAQAQSSEPMKVRVPFAFMVGDVQFSAGECTIQPISVLGGVLIRSYDGGGQLIVMTSPITQLEYVREQKIVFHRYGGTYFLSELWAVSERTGRVLRPSVREAQIASDGQPQHVTVLNPQG